MPKCREKACIFPAFYGDLCRQHYDDNKALVSIMPSTMLILLRNPSGVMHGSWEEYQAHGE